MHLEINVVDLDKSCPSLISISFTYTKLKGAGLNIWEYRWERPKPQIIGTGARYLVY